MLAQPLQRWLASLCTNAVVRSLLLGQVISLLIAGTGLFSSLLAERGVSIPTSQSTLNYALLLVYAVRTWRRGGFASLRGRPEWVRLVCIYALLAVLDVEANYLVVKAYSMTSITSIMLIDCLSIPVAMALSRVQFTLRHVAGVGVCVAGLAVLVASDYLRHSGDDASSASADGVVVGDIMCAAAAALYGASNVGQEAMVKAYDREEFLGMLGVFGSVVNAVQLLVLEREELAVVATDGVVLGCIAGFAVCLFSMYSLTSIFLSHADATLFNLSLLTSDAWAIIISVFLFHDTIHPLYFVALFLIVVGLVTYNSAASPTRGAERESADSTPSRIADELTPVVSSSQTMLTTPHVSTQQNDAADVVTDVARSPLFARAARGRSDDHIRILDDA